MDTVKGRLDPYPRGSQNSQGDKKNAEETFHHLLVQPPANPDQECCEQKNEQDIADGKDRRSFKGDRAVDDVHGPARKNAGRVGNGENDQQRGRRPDIGLPAVRTQQGGFAGIGNKVMEYAEKQDVINAAQGVEKRQRRIRTVVHQVVEQQVRAGGADQHAQHGAEDPEGFHPDLEGNEQEHEHDETDRQHCDLAGRIILFHAHGIHLFIPHLCSRKKRRAAIGYSASGLLKATYPIILSTV